MAYWILSHLRPYSCRKILESREVERMRDRGFREPESIDLGVKRRVSQWRSNKRKEGKVALLSVILD